MTQVSVERVEKGVVTERFGDILLTFSVVDKKIRLISKLKEGASIYDPKDLWLSKKIFITALRQAAAILHDQQRRSHP